MKTKILSLTVALVAVLLSGCVNNGNTHLGSNIKPLPYKDGEKSIVTTDKTFTYDNTSGKLLASHKKIEKTMPAVNEGIQHGKMGMVASVEESRAKGLSGWFFKTTTPAFYARRERGWQGIGYSPNEGGAWVNVNGPNEPVYGSGVWGH